MRNPKFTQHHNNKGFTIIELIVVALAFILMIGALTPFVNMARSRSQRFACAENLRKISLALHLYAAEHNDSFPASMGELYPRYVGSEKVFDCPASGKAGNKQEPDYKYFFGLTESSPPREVIVEDLGGNHSGLAKNRLRIDGSIEWTDAKGR